jgi:hypothetical protein
LLDREQSLISDHLTIDSENILLHCRSVASQVLNLKSLLRVTTASFRSNHDVRDVLERKSVQLHQIRLRIKRGLQQSMPAL